MRGGVREPLTREELERKFRLNIAHGGWPAVVGEELLEFCKTIAEQDNLTALGTFRV
jgi:hypothetical protein